MTEVVETKSQNEGWDINQTGYFYALILPALQIRTILSFYENILLFHPCASFCDF